MDVDDQYFIIENRIASFHAAQTISKSGKGTKTVQWPHRAPSPMAVSALPGQIPAR
jgi:hypothetical protein